MNFGDVGHEREGAVEDSRVSGLGDWMNHDAFRKRGPRVVKDGGGDLVGR